MARIESVARMAVWESAKADFGPLLPRIHPPGVVGVWLGWLGGWVAGWLEWLGWLGGWVAGWLG
ncbi:MAG TPA: hypothetical protein VFJ16_06480 [Longimicrobium sp.]|nr:hypothetical protein [Longimicrobium sp.]